MLRSEYKNSCLLFCEYHFVLLFVFVPYMNFRLASPIWNFSVKQRFPTRVDNLYHHPISGAMWNNSGGTSREEKYNTYLLCCLAVFSELQGSCPDVSYLSFL